MSMMVVKVLAASPREDVAQNESDHKRRYNGRDNRQGESLGRVIMLSRCRDDSLHSCIFLRHNLVIISIDITHIRATAWLNRLRRGRQWIGIRPPIRASRIPAVFDILYKVLTTPE